MDADSFADWIRGYERLWRSPGTADLGELFSSAVAYSMGPYEATVHGLEALARTWESERRSADEDFELEASVVAVDGDTCVARVDVRYGAPAPQEYSEVWIVGFDAEGRCESFQEWTEWPGSGRPTI